MSEPPANQRSKMGTVGMAIVAALCASAVSGCRKPVFSMTEDRSQFERFDVSRDERAEPFLEDEYGRKVPNLRARLVR